MVKKQIRIRYHDAKFLCQIIIDSIIDAIGSLDSNVHQSMTADRMLRYATVGYGISYMLIRWVRDYQPTPGWKSGHIWCTVSIYSGSPNANLLMLHQTVRAPFSGVLPKQILVLQFLNNGHDSVFNPNLDIRMPCSWSALVAFLYYTLL